MRESATATTNKFWTAWEMLQPMLRQIGWHCILAKICSQRISFQPRSRLNQCTSSITQHVTPACYSTLWHSITYLHAIRGYALFHTQKEIDGRCNTLEETVCFNIFKHTMVTRQRASVLLHAGYCKNGDGFQANLRFRNPFQICSFLLLQPRHMIYHIWMCMHYEPKTTLSEDWLLASYCSFDTLWNASAKARPLPMSQSIKMPCMRQANIWKQKTACACTIRQALLHCTYNSGPIVCFSLLAVCCINEFEAMIIKSIST